MGQWQVQLDGSVPVGISAAGRVLLVREWNCEQRDDGRPGFSFDFNQSWFKQGSDLDYFMDIPPGNGGSDTFATGVNHFADIVGFDRRGWLAKKIELGEGTGDSGEVKPAFISILFPGTQQGQTFPMGINDVRGIVGTYIDSTGKQHGFLAK